MMPLGNPGKLTRLFKERFPLGYYLDVERGVVRRRTGGASFTPVIRRILRIISRAGTSSVLRRFDAGECDMTVFSPAGTPSVVFMIPKTVQVSERVEWAQIVYRASLAASLK